ncbi:MAG TPA: hypothetical protein VMI54_13630 [Polyangiaceae bacterium]|nr:hypothetical protein [Polyangiaceae bacterium]
MRRARRSFLAAACGSALVSLAGGARAQASGTVAEALFRDAQKLLADGHVHEACEKFAASQKADPALGTRLNLAVCHEREGRSATAWLEFSEVASLAQKAGDSAREKYAAARLNKIEPTLHKVTLDADAPADGIVLVLDGTNVAPSAFGVAIPVDPGDHELRATAPGRAPWSTHFTTSAEPGTERITVPELAPAQAPPPAPPPAAAPLAPPQNPVPPPSAPPEPSGGGLDLRHGLIYGSAAVAAVGIGAGIYFGVSTANHASKRDALCAPGVACYDQRAFDEHHAAEVAQRWMLVTGGIGLVAAGAAAALLVVPLTTENQRAEVHASPWFAPGALGATAVGSF